jgi:hypothetical protein
VADVSKTLDARWAVLQDTVPSPMLNDGFLFDIDLAIKDKVSDIYVSDEKAGEHGRLVAAYFRNPPSELTKSGQVQFPHIIIDRLTYRPARDREQRSENPYIPYVPKGFTAPTGVDANGDPRTLVTREMPIPYDFIYQITASSRSYKHDREVQTAMLANERFPPRGAYLVVGEDPNQTIRQMFVTDDSPREDNRMVPAEGGTNKRLFRSIWTCSVSAELFQADLQILQQVTSVNVDIGLIQPD